MAFSPFFALAAVSPTRQQTFRTLVGAHVLVLGLTIFGLQAGNQLQSPALLGHVLLVAGILEGGLLVGWRLTQLPKSQALEFLLVSQLRPAQVFFAEASVGLARLAFVSLAGLPLLLLLIAQGLIFFGDLPALLLLPWIWGSVTGLALTQYAFEPQVVRRWAERGMMVLIVVYLLVGVLAGENLAGWLSVLPTWFGQGFLDLFHGFHAYNPFGVMRHAFETTPDDAWPRVLGIGAVGLALIVALALRAAARLQGHFQEEHYRPILLKDKKARPIIGEWPLTWWAVKRVTKFSGRINLWLAGGFTIMYAAFTVFEPVWPQWLGSQVFLMFGRLGGLPVLTTALVLLAAVPAAFQYGLWDSNVPDRCRRLELLLLTRLDGPSYWHASASAAWNRGRGYFALALILWWAGLISGQLTLAQVMASVCAGVVLWGLYFALGFQAFARGLQANLLGMALTLALPLAAALLNHKGHVFLAALLPPGAVYYPLTAAFDWPNLTGAIAGAVLALGFAKGSLLDCDRELRRWYDANHGTAA